MFRSIYKQKNPKGFFCLVSCFLFQVSLRVKNSKQPDTAHINHKIYVSVLSHIIKCEVVDEFATGAGAATDDLDEEDA